MTALDPNTAGKLAKLCGLFGSDHDGERASAAAMADKIIKANGLSWFDVIRPRPLATAGKIRFALGYIDVLSRWEHGFLLGIRHKADRLSDRQLATLDAIVAKIGCDL